MPNTGDGGKDELILLGPGKEGPWGLEPVLFPAVSPVPEQCQHIIRGQKASGNEMCEPMGVNYPYCEDGWIRPGLVSLTLGFWQGEPVQLTSTFEPPQGERSHSGAEHTLQMARMVTHCLEKCTCLLTLSNQSWKRIHSWCFAKTRLPSLPGLY